MAADRGLSRRGLLRGGVAALAFPSLVPSIVLGRGQTPPSERLNLGFIGVRNQGANNLNAFLGQKSARVAALCDVDSKVLQGAGKVVVLRGGGSVPLLHDYRELLGRPDIDAVVITTPDHWHARPAIDAMKAGKDVYCEKPLTLTVAEGRAIAGTARTTGRVLQTGSQQRSDDRFRKACELVRSGALGPLKSVLVGLPAVNFEGPPVADSEVPPELDYDFWLGPAPEAPYNSKKVHYNFRFFWPYSGGQLTNWGAHHLDIVQWALGRDDSGPEKITGEARYHPHAWYDVPTQSVTVFNYGDLEVTCRQGHGDRNGVEFRGEAGKLFVSRQVIEAEPASLLDAAIPEGSRLERSTDHHQNWLSAIRTRARPICDAEVGHRSATVCHLGNLALRTGRELRWDPALEAIDNDPEAAAMLSRPARPPWGPPS
jgi:predicted dehydrogenase